MNVKYTPRKRFSPEEYAECILKGDRIMLSRAITLIESKLPSDVALAEKVLELILPYTGKSLRVGITGVPGVGKSTFIESFGGLITSMGKKLAVLTIDPSSQRSKGSILGDKTRMESLANDPMAYIRPSASGATLGGVNDKTRETMLLCEAAGYEVVLIETVGVGQSETTVAAITDFFLLLMLAGAGDELQGIKKGIMEMCDALVITKADGDNVNMSRMAAREYQNALRLFPAHDSGWEPEVLTCSSLKKEGLEAIWDVIVRHHELVKKTGHFDAKRMEQNIAWMNEIIDYYLKYDFLHDTEVEGAMDFTSHQVESGKLPAITAAKKLLSLYRKKEM
ncbi:MAG: methylmalonyl Co-A mutase-associated GTPase MeaB [Flavobacteriales bacterium]|jgi:LAO/AO transport system kinase|nr:methylmalonyl Co-A mutase-associated GTPase MeaB [Flavobacteriales bacterium]